MIEINLVPQHLRRKKATQALLGKFNIPMEIIIGTAGGLFILLLLIDVLLFVVNVTRLAQYKTLKVQWAKMAPEKEKVDAIITELRTMKGSYAAIEEMTVKHRANWSQKLNIISDSIPRSVWLSKINLDKETFTINGSMLSRGSSEIKEVHDFVSSLKSSEQFMERFESLELGSIQRNRIKEIELVDFLVSIKLKKEEKIEPEEIETKDAKGKKKKKRVTKNSKSKKKTKKK